MWAENLFMDMKIQVIKGGEGYFSAAAMAFSASGSITA